MKKVLLVLAVFAFCFNLKAQYPYPKAVDFDDVQTIITALESHGVRQHDCDSPVVGPKVEITLCEVTTTTAEAILTPNADCASFWFMIGIESEMLMLQQSMGVTLEQLVQICGPRATETTTYKWIKLHPATENTIYVLPADADGNTYDVICETFTTPCQGGPGEALVELTVDLISNTEAAISAVPNPEVAEYHYGIITVDSLNEIGEEAAAEFFRLYYPYFEPSEYTWNDLEPNTHYYALGTAKNVNDEWGATTLVEFFTDFDGVMESFDSYAVYPNPSTDYLYLTTSDDISDLSYKLFDMNGKLLKSGEIVGNQTDICVRGLAPSIYFVKLCQGNKTIKTYKIIKK